MCFVAVMVSDDTDSCMHDGRWRVKIDAEDEADHEWLVGGNNALPVLKTEDVVTQVLC